MISSKGVGKRKEARRTSGRQRLSNWQMRKAEVAIVVNAFEASQVKRLLIYPFQPSVQLRRCLQVGHNAHRPKQP